MPAEVPPIAASSQSPILFFPYLSVDFLVGAGRRQESGCRTKMAMDARCTPGLEINMKKRLHPAIILIRHFGGVAAATAGAVYAMWLASRSNRIGDMGRVGNDARYVV